MKPFEKVHFSDFLYIHSTLYSLASLEKCKEDIPIKAAFMCVPFAGQWKAVHMSHRKQR